MLTCLFALIGSVFIDPKSCPWVWLKIICGTYPTWTYRFDNPVGLLKVIVRVPVGCKCLLTSIDCFYLYKISFKWFTLTFIIIVDLCILHLLDQRSLILKLVLWCDWNFSVVHIQTGYTNLLPLQVCGRLWQWYWLCG